MENRSIVAAICDQADDLLVGVTRRDDAKADLAAWLALNHGQLPPAERKAIIAQALEILESEEFFRAAPGGEA